MNRIIQGIKHIDEVAEGVYNFKLPKDFIEKRRWKGQKFVKSALILKMILLRIFTWRTG